MKTRSFLPALLSALSFGALRHKAKQPVVHEDKRLDDVFNPDPAHRSRGGKKSSGGSRYRRSTRRRSNPMGHAWKKAFGGLAVPACTF